MNKLKTKGFTLIEVVIVLAVGALIILVVLQAVTSAQRNQRDSARRSEAARISAALESRAANNNGVYPTTGGFAAFLTQYEPELATKGWVNAGTFAGACAAQTSTTYQVRYTVAPNSRDYDLKGCLEQGEVILRQ